MPLLGKTLEENTMLKFGPMLRPVQLSVLLSSSIKTSLIQSEHFQGLQQKAM
jgi:hypothetical protein